MPPDWKLPPGVTRGLWEYVHAEHIARDYDDYFALHKLFEIDEAVLARYFEPGKTVADLGCGSGRALIPLVRRGLRGVAIDLSQEMLAVVAEKAALEQLDIRLVQANLVELDELAEASVDYAMCLFSTLGMIRGYGERLKALGHIHRMLKPDGLFVLHVHNYWYNLYDPGGPWWLLKNLCRASFVRDLERGDKFFPYRGIPNMFLHVFPYREIRRALNTAGFTPVETIPLDVTRGRVLPQSWLCGNLRASGWIFVERRGNL